MRGGIPITGFDKSFAGFSEKNCRPNSSYGPALAVQRAGGDSLAGDELAQYFSKSTPPKTSEMTGMNDLDRPIVKALHTRQK